MKPRAKSNANFEEDLQKVVDILQARGVDTAVIGMAHGVEPQQVLFGDCQKMLVLCASIMRRISDLTGNSYEETADVVKEILMFATKDVKPETKTES